MAKKEKITPDKIAVNGNKNHIRKPRKKENDVHLTDAQKFLHDIQLHQVELEISNDELKAEKEQYRLVFRKSPSAVLLLDPEDCRILDCSEKAAGFYGLPPDELCGKRFTDMGFTENGEPVSLESRLQNVQNPVSLRQETGDMKIRDIKAEFEKIVLDDKLLIIAAIEDSTGSRHAEQVKKERDFWTNEACRRERLGSFTIDFQNDSWSASSQFDEIIGLDQCFNRTISSFLTLVHPDDRAGFQYHLFSEVIARKQPLDREFRINRHSDNNVRFLKGYGNLDFDSEGKLISLQGAVRDITGTGYAGTHSRHSEDLYSQIMNALPEGIVIFNAEGYISEISGRVLEQSGTGNIDDLIGKHFRTFVPWEEKKKISVVIEKLMTDATPQSMECRLIRPDNTQLIGEVSLSKIKQTDDNRRSYIAIVRDVTERKKKEQKLIHMDRMAHLGEMATGMAHEINQPLNNISLTLDNIFHEIRLKDTLHDTYLQHKSNKIFDNIVKIKNLIEHIRDFSRDDHSNSRITFDINETIHNTLSVLLARFEAQNIELLLDLEERLNLYEGDAFKVEQVLMNILLNASDALEEKQMKSPDDFQKVVKIKSFQEDQMLCIEITDNGIGIKANELQKIMHPFYTTKETGKGVGLGLSISYGIINGMNGKIEVESKYMIGTTFRIAVPALLNQTS